MSVVEFEMQPSRRMPGEAGPWSATGTRQQTAVAARHDHLNELLDKE